jgi:hypothetical protein
MSYFSKKTSKTIYFTDDILEELSAKTGKDKALLADIIKQNLSYLKKEISEKEDIVTVNFPNFGKMLFNYYLGLCSIPRVTNNNLKNKLKARISYLYSVLIVKNGNKLKNFNKPLISISTYNLLKSTPKNIINTFYKNWKILEDKHNEDHEKYF